MPATDIVTSLDAAHLLRRVGFGPTAAEIGALTADLAQRLAPSAGLRNLLVHRYGDVRLDLLAGGIAATLNAYPVYIQQVSAYLLTLDD